MTEAQERRKAKRAAWLAGKQAETATRMQVIPRDGRGRRVYGNTVREISRDASRRGVIHNTPVKVNAGGYVVSSAP